MKSNCGYHRQQCPLCANSGHSSAPSEFVDFKLRFLGRGFGGIGLRGPSEKSDRALMLPGEATPVAWP